MGEARSASRKAAGNDDRSVAAKRPARPKPEKDGRGFDLAADFVMGLRFYSRLPIAGLAHETPDLSRIAPALPFVSLLINLGPVIVLMLAAAIGMPPLFSAALALAALVVVTGAMAEDAIADSADGLFGGHTIERRLEILKDSRHGTYGVTALVLLLMLRAGLLAAMAGHSIFATAGIWLAAGILSRSGALWLTYALPPARNTGASAAAGRVGRIAYITGAVFAIILAFILAAPFSTIAGLAAAIAALVLVTYGWQRLCAHLLGGQTGDLIGALQALLEVTALAVLSGFAM